MSNQYHVVLETPDANLVPGMAWRQSTCTIRLNHRHKLIGHVLSEGERGGTGGVTYGMNRIRVGLAGQAATRLSPAYVITESRVRFAARRPSAGVSKLEERRRIAWATNSKTKARA